MPEVSAKPETAATATPSGTASDHAALSFVNVFKTFADGTAALSNISFDVRDGEFVTVVGPSGCGKSTLLKIASKLIPAIAGEVAGRWPIICAPNWSPTRSTWPSRITGSNRIAFCIPTAEHNTCRPTTARGWPISGSGIPSDEPVNAWDNALAESFFASLKNERVHHMVYPTRKKAKDDTMATKGVLAYFDALTA